MDGAEGRGAQFDALHAEAKAALTYSANTLRAVRDRYRAAYVDEIGRLQHLRDELDALEGRAADRTIDDAGAAASLPALEAAEAGARDAQIREARRRADQLAADLGRCQSELSRLELAIRSLDSTWVFLERGDATLIGAQDAPITPAQQQMKIVEAQEAERARLAQEVHDGPAQALSNAIFQVEYIERVLETDARLARAELGFLRELLRRELGDVRSFITQLRPPVLVELGLDGSLMETATTMATLSSIQVRTDLRAPAERLTEPQQTVVLRIVQEALQNVRKHAAATTITLSTRVADDAWVVEVHDDGRGFDVGAVAARGRRNFGLQFMRERAELIGAAFEVRSRPDGGSVVRLAIPLSEKESQ
ncbi:MAG TPA: sensor histidine kinase [Candidatus Limnocylindrales bacterium]|nr:sensor histidine kinase [Candidatus Limnocylindrales bacterium]